MKEGVVKGYPGEKTRFTGIGLPAHIAEVFPGF
jgi:hypothetical protein